jgi:hypothetical protein
MGLVSVMVVFFRAPTWWDWGLMSLVWLAGAVLTVLISCVPETAGESSRTGFAARTLCAARTRRTIPGTG